MTIITLATVGYGEVHPLDHLGRWFTIAVIVAGFAVFVNTTAQLTSLLLSGEISGAISRRRDKMRNRLEGHVIVVGYGRVGRATVASGREAGLQCAVVEEDLHAPTTSPALVQCSSKETGATTRRSRQRASTGRSRCQRHSTTRTTSSSP